MGILLLSTALAIAVASASFGVVGLGLLKRRYSADHRTVAVAFAVAWFALAVAAWTDAARVIAATTGVLDGRVHAALMAAKILTAPIAIWGLGYYVTFLWTGRGRWSTPLALFAAAHAVVFLFLLARRLPLTVATGEWAIRTAFAQAPAAPWMQGVGTLLFFLPPIVLAVAYLGLVLRVRSRSLRARVVAVGLAIVVYHLASALLHDPDRSADTPAFALLSVVSATAALLTYVVYHPPAWMQRRFGIQPPGSADARTS